jgi:hypothetical protein
MPTKVPALIWSRLLGTMPEIRVAASRATFTLPSLVFTVRLSGVAETIVPRMWPGGLAAIAADMAVTDKRSAKALATVLVGLDLELILFISGSGVLDC